MSEYLKANCSPNHNLDSSSSDGWFDQVASLGLTAISEDHDRECEADWTKHSSERTLRRELAVTVILTSKAYIQCWLRSSRNDKIPVSLQHVNILTPPRATLTEMWAENFSGSALRHEFSSICKRVFHVTLGNHLAN